MAISFNSHVHGGTAKPLLETRSLLDPPEPYVPPPHGETSNQPGTQQDHSSSSSPSPSPPPPAPSPAPAPGAAQPHPAEQPLGFRRRQAFRGVVAGKPWRFLSVGWQRNDGGEQHCVLAVLQGTHLITVDALAGEADALPWSCDGEPALRSVDLDGDGCPEVLALYPMRPPSGERFMWPVVLRCDATRVAWELDAVRTRRLRESLDKAPLKTLRQAQDLLR